MRTRAIISGMVAALLLSGCVLRIVYNQLDWLALWYMEDYVDFTPAQKKQAQALIRESIDWHRTVQLPRYAELTGELIASAGKPVTARDVEEHYEQVVVLWDQFLVQIIPGSAALMQTFSDDQVAGIFEQLADENEDLDEEYSGSTAEVRRKKQVKAVTRAFRRFTGRLDDAQLAMIQDHVAEMHDVSADWLRRRAAWQKAFRELLESGRRSPDFAARFSDLVLDPNQFDSPGYREQVRENQRVSFELVAEVLNSLTARQSSHLRDELQGYLADFQSLIRQAKPRPAAAGKARASRGEAGRGNAGEEESGAEERT